MSDAKQVNQEVLKEVVKSHDLKGTHTHESVSVAAAKVQLELKKQPELNHVDAPADGLTEATKKAYLEEKKGGQ